MKRKNLFSRIASLVLAAAMLMGVCMLTGCMDEEEVAYSGSATEYDDVYVDIVSIEPMIKVSTNNIDTHTVCECYTTNGSTVWVYISINEYLRLFDATATFEGDDWWADCVSLPAATRIHGEMREAEDMCDGLSYDIGTDLLIQFDSKD